MSASPDTRFDIGRVLGEGGMGVVHEAYDRERQMPVALKRLRRLDPGSLERFKREFRAIADLNHPNVVQLYELIGHGDEWFFTMELVDGVDLLSYACPPFEREHAADQLSEDDSLDTRTVDSVEELPGAGDDDTRPLSVARDVPELANRPPLSARTREKRLRAALAQLAEALDAVHRRGIVHRDVKPSNVLVTRTGRVVLMDFGIVTDRDDQSMPGMSVLGTPAFMAPEQTERAPVTAAADWYAFGTLLYLALTWRFPFGGSQIELLRSKRLHAAAPPSRFTMYVPADLEALCIGLLRPVPEERLTGPQVLARLGPTSRGANDSSMADIFVGRRSELDRMHRAFGHAGEETTVLLLHGPSGIGKSTLVRRFLDGLGAVPCVLTGRCHERESMPYKGFDGVMERLSRILHALPPVTRARLLPRGGQLLPRMFPALAWLLPASTADGDASGALGGDHRKQRMRAFAAVRELLAALARVGPLVIVIDDLQWADKETLDLLEAIVRPGEDAPRLLFVALRRDERTPAAEALTALLDGLPEGQVERVPIGPLSGADEAALVSELMGSLPSAVKVTAAYFAGSEGNPLMMAELARFAQDQGAGAELADHALTFEDALMRRFDALPAPARDLAHAIFVAAEPTALSVLSATVSLDGARREQALAMLRSGNLIRVTRSGPDPWVDAFHDRIRNTIVATLPAWQREALHRALADALATREGHGPEQLARHRLAGGDPPGAARWFARAAAQAFEKLAFDHTVELGTLALAHGTFSDEELVHLRRLIADALACAGRGTEAAAAYLAAAEHAAGAARIELLEAHAEQLLRSGNIASGRDALAAVLARLGVRVPRGRIPSIAHLALQRAKLRLRGFGYKPRAAAACAPEELRRLDLFYSAAISLGIMDHIPGLALQTQHILAALDYGEETRVGRAIATEVIFLGTKGRPDDPHLQQLWRKAQELAERTGDAKLNIYLRMIEGGVYLFSSQFERSLAPMAEAEAYYTNVAVGMAWERVTCFYAQFLALVYLGRIDEIAARVTGYLAEETTSDPYAHNVLASDPSVWRGIRQDRTDEAEQILATALTGWPAGEFTTSHYRAAVARMLLLLYQGDRDVEAVELGAQTVRQMRRSFLVKVPHVAARMGQLWGIAALRAGRQRDLRDARNLVRAQPLRPYQVAERYFSGALAARSGGVEAARPYLEEAVRLADETDFRLYGEAIRYRLGVILGGDEGARLVDRAVAFMRGVGVVNPTRLLETLAPALGGNRA